MDRYTYAVAKLMKSEKLIIDTSSLMESHSLSSFVDKHSHILTAKKIVILPAVYAELSKHLASADEHKRVIAAAALQYIQDHEQFFSLPTSFSSGNHGFADADILEYLLRSRSKFITLLITQDKKLAQDALKLNDISSCYGHKTYALRFDDQGCFQTFTSGLSPHIYESTTINVVDTAHSPQIPVSANSPKEKASRKAFSRRDFVFGIFTGVTLVSTGLYLFSRFREDR